MTFRLRRIMLILLVAVVIILACTVAAAAGKLVGDADTDGDVTILDATCIQRTLANLPVTAYDEESADADGDGDITILDATAIQRWLASLKPPYPIGQEIGAPPEPSEDQPSESPTQLPTDAEGWGREIFRP